MGTLRCEHELAVDAENLSWGEGPGLSPSIAAIQRVPWSLVNPTSRRSGSPVVVETHWAQLAVVGALRVVRHGRALRDRVEVGGPAVGA